MNSEKSQSHNEPSIGGLLRDDIRRGGYFRTLRREIEDLQDFMLTEERRKSLEQMSQLKRWMVLPLWLLKSLFQKLAPMRRLMVIIALWMLVAYRNVKNANENLFFLGGLVLLFVLLLELKDKLLAREELEAGRAVQKALMPPPRPKVPGWDIWLFTRSANEVGGDLLEFINITDERYGIALGDIAGKGLRAALLSAKLQATLQAYVPDFPSLSALAAKLNQAFCRYSLPNIFASLMYLELQADSDKVKLVNAGHLPPAIIRGNKVEKLAKGNMALGLTSKAKYKESKLSLSKGEWMIIYSDGLTDAQNEEDVLFGEERIQALLPSLTPFAAERIGQKIVASVDEFIGDARTIDDLSIAIIRRI
jgi:sigma-B regulation protein RsbU (phosphoserine phosphatase)